MKCVCLDLGVTALAVAAAAACRQIGGRDDEDEAVAAMTVSLQKSLEKTSLANESVQLSQSSILFDCALRLVGGSGRGGRGGGGDGGGGGEGGGGGSGVGAEAATGGAIESSMQSVSAPMP